MENIFNLTPKELKNIANALQVKIEEGLKKDGMEISDIPTHIDPKQSFEDKKVLVLDWGGTNFRAAIVEFKDGKASIIESKRKPLSAKETTGFSASDLHREMAELISKLEKLDRQVTQIGYCFSYPAASRLNGDAILLRWTKGIDIPEMSGKPVGELLLKYLNTYKEIGTSFTDIKVINDTVACLFAGLLSKTVYDAYIGLIVGTGTNMAALMRLNKIEKLNSKGERVIPVNLESGNFTPPYLTVIDGLVDAMSNNKGQQRFEKAISGGYLGEIFRTVFCDRKIKYDLDSKDLSDIINNPKNNPEEYVTVARRIYVRSAKLVAASIAGLVQVLVSHDESVRNICLAADGSLFWSDDYSKLVSEELKELLPVELNVTLAPKTEEPNLIGSAIAALS
ncbi:MAG: hexokinase [Candidatus Azobacteroides sp.]|nr:hexokinase [Candidatus Azobacteroides sp.]